MSKSSDRSKTLSVVERVEDLSERFNSLHDRLLRIEQKDPDSFQSSSTNVPDFLSLLEDLRDRMDTQDFLFHLEDLRDRMDQFESEYRLTQDLHALKLPRQAEPPITPKAFPLHTPKVDSSERQAQEQSKKLGDVSFQLSELGNKSDDVFVSRLHVVFETKLHSAMGPLKEELAALQERVSHILVGPSEKEFAALQERVSQLSVLQQDAEEQELSKASFQSDLIYLKQPFDEKALRTADVKGDVDEFGTSSVADTDGVGTSRRESSLLSKMSFARVRLEYEEYQWQESLWEISILVWTKQMSTPSSLAACICLFCYLLLLGLLVSESTNAISQVSFDVNSRVEFSFWRSSIAHQVNLRNTVTGESLARSVCDQRKYVPFGTLQLDTVQVLSDYLEPHPFIPSMHTGSFMCILVLIVWCIRLLQELDLTLDLMSALAVLPISPSTTFKQDVKNPSVELVSLSKCRLVFSLALSLCRIAMVIVLGWSGSQFLVQETSMTEMLLNAVALQFILELDELIFCALLPKQPRSSFRRVEPLKYELPRLWAWHRVGYIMIVLSLGVLIKFWALDPYVVELNENLEALCGGVDDSSFDFVIAVDSIGLPWAAPTSSSGTMTLLYAHEAVLQAKKFGFPRQLEPLRGTDRQNDGPFMQLGSAFDLESYMLTTDVFGGSADWTVINPESQTKFVGWNEMEVLRGVDFGDGHGTVYNQYLQFLLGASWKVNCSHVPLRRCYDYGDGAGLVLRKLCPNHCGCDSPTSGTVSNAFARHTWSHPDIGFQGCSGWIIKTKSFVEIVGDLSCEDANSSVFTRWLHGVGDARNVDGVPLADHLSDSFEGGGCPAVVTVNLGMGGRICAESSLPAICPTSCGCNETVGWNAAHAWRMEYCPQSCGRGELVHCHTVHVNHTVDTGAYGPFADLPCIFPFEYMGKTYNNCTTEAWTGPWCAVSKNNLGRMRTWGDCPPRC